MPPTPQLLPPTTLLLPTKRRTGMSLVDSPTRDTKSTNHATRLTTTSPSMDKGQATTLLWMPTGTSTSATANQYMADVQVKSTTTSQERLALRRNNPSPTPMRTSTRESTLRLKRPSVISSLRPSTDASALPSTAALTSKTERYYTNNH